MTADRYTVSLYRCTACDHEDRAAEAHNFDDDPYNGLCCPECGNGVTWVRDRPARYVSVAVYEVDRAYGGPEEGGWYYDAGTVLRETIRCFEAGDLPQLDAHREVLSRRYPDGGGIDGRLYVRTMVEQVPPEHFPSRRPVYC